MGVLGRVLFVGVLGLVSEIEPVDLDTGVFGRVKEVGVFVRFAGESGSVRFGVRSPVER